MSLYLSVVCSLVVGMLLAHLALRWVDKFFPRFILNSDAGPIALSVFTVGVGSFATLYLLTALL